MNQEDSSSPDSKRFKQLGTRNLAVPVYSTKEYVQWTALFVSLARRVANLYAWSEEQCIKLSEELFFALLCKAAYGEESRLLSIPPRLDLLWHEFILETYPYKEFCDNVCRVFLHHTQFTADDELSVKQARVRLALSVYAKIIPSRKPDEW